MPIHILAIGKKHESWVIEGIERYQKRLKTPFSCEWSLLPHSSREDNTAKQEESGRILERVKPTDYVILLDERGILYDSPRVAHLLLDPLERSQSVVIIIGGAYGVNSEVQSRANATWSLSPLVFPHQLVRLLLVEQLYRAQEITFGGPYHHK